MEWRGGECAREQPQCHFAALPVCDWPWPGTQDKGQHYEGTPSVVQKLMLSAGVSSYPLTLLEPLPGFAAKSSVESHHVQTVQLRQELHAPSVSDFGTRVTQGLLKSQGAG